MTQPPHRPSSGDPLGAEIERAAEGLVYSSEGDSPFDFFSREAKGTPIADARALAALLDGPLGEADEVEERTLDQFFKRHIETSDSYDTRAQEIRPRYESLRALLRRELAGVRVLRVRRRADRAVVRCYVVGLDPRGQLVGLATSAIET